MTAAPFRIIVTGPRDMADGQPVWRALAAVIGEDAPPDAPIVLVHGDCEGGADRHASRWCTAAIADGRRPVREEKHPAQNHPTQDFGPWPAAGPRRNAYVVGLGADVTVAFISPCTRAWCRKPRPHTSHGTDNCVRLAERAGIPVRRFTV